MRVVPQRRFPALAALCAMLLLVALALPAQQKRAMTFMDIMEMRSVGAGSFSPDGKWVLFTISIPHWKSGRNFTDIFVAPADASSPARQMTFTAEKSESQPRWTRDSKQFAFLADRDGSAQIYLMRPDGGEARKITDAKDGVNTFNFSRDGKFLAFSAGKPEDRQLWLLDLSAGDDAKPAQLTKHPTPINAWDWSPDSTRIFFLSPDKVDKDDQKRRQQRFDVRIADEPNPHAHLWSVTLADKSTKRWIESSAYSVAQIAIAPNAARLVFRATANNRHANRLTQDDSDLYLLDLGSAAITRLTQNSIREGMASFSPDSQWLVFTAPDDFTQARNTKFYLLPAAGGTPRKLLPDWDHSAGNPAWSKDSKSLYFNEGIGVDQHTFALSIPDGKLTQLTRERGVIGGPGYDDETGLFLFTFTDPTWPAEYYVARPETIGQRARWTRVSNANPQVAKFSLGEYETVRWKSSDGQMVEGILIKPVGYEAGKKYPLIVQIHGGPAAADTNTFSVNYGSYVHIFAANGYAVLKPNYRGSDNYGEKFRTQISRDYFRQAHDDIQLGVDHLIARGIADPDKLGMMGWSAGGHWSNWTMTQTDRFKAISTGAGAVNWISMYAQTDVQAPREFYFGGKPWENWDHYLEVSPLKYIKNAKTPTLIHVGEADQRVPKPQSDELHMALKKLGVPVEYIVYPNMPHGITLPRYQMVKMVAEFYWFEKWIKGKPGWFEWKEMLATLEEPKPAEEKKEQKAAEDNDGR